MTKEIKHHCLPTIDEYIPISSLVSRVIRVGLYRLGHPFIIIVSPHLNLLLILVLLLPLLLCLLLAPNQVEIPRIQNYVQMKTIVATLPTQRGTNTVLSKRAIAKRGVEEILTKTLAEETAAKIPAK